jgi:hypothetical protein
MSKVHSKKAKDVKGGTTCVDIIQNVMEQWWKNKGFMISLFYEHKQNLEVCKENYVNKPKNSNLWTLWNVRKKWTREKKTNTTKEWDNTINIGMWFDGEDKIHMQ